MSGIGSLTYEERLEKLGLTILQAMVDTYKIVNQKVDVSPSILFSRLDGREGAASTRATSGHSNVAKTEAKSDIRLPMTSLRTNYPVS